MDPVRKEIVVEASPERAFRVFTDKFGQWWPRDHSIGEAALKDAIIEPRVGGRWYEVKVDGSEGEWGKVLVWDPPRRIVMAWQLNARWEYDPNFLTELELRFTPVGPMKTRVELEHRNMDRFGEAEAVTREALDSPQGWTGLLTLFAKAAQEEHENA